MKTLIVVVLASLIITGYAIPAFAGSDSSDILKEGILGAATGAVASSASGGEAGKGALIGAGVNIIGGALFDAMSGEKVATVDQVNNMPSQGAFQEGYNQGFNQGYQQGYNTGFTKGYEVGKK